jgi:hypothetical protein
MGEAGWQRAHQLFDERKVVERQLHAYSDLIEKCGLN